MSPRYIDWNGNGQIDPVDIGVSTSLGDDRDNDDIEVADNPHSRLAQTSGCLSSVLVILSAIAVLVMVFAIML